MEIKDLLREAGIYSPKHAEQIGMSRHLYTKALQENILREPWQELLSLRAGRHPDWPGFKIGRGIIETPSGQRVTAGQIDQMPWLENLAYERGREEAEGAQLRLAWS